MKKCGYHAYTEMVAENSGQEPCALIMDESMMLGSEKMMLVLLLPARKESSEPVGFSDAQVLKIAVRPSWNS